MFEPFLFYPKHQPELKRNCFTLPTTRYFPEKGYVVSRTDWGRDATVFAFTCGKGTKRINAQSDHGSFTLYANNTPIVIDSGTRNLPEEGSPSQTKGHNYILIDGKGMALSGRGAATSGQIEAFINEKLYDYILGDTKVAYNQDKYNPVHHAYRHALFVKTPFPYLVLWDCQKPSALQSNM